LAVDPQARWILEGVWNAILDSKSVGVKDLAALRVGMYCGIMNNEMTQTRQDAGVDFSLNACGGSVAGFVSHMFGFQGPCLDVNTMCSSGLVCLELATEALARGSCDVAFVAAANWIGGESGYRNIGSVNALSKDGLQDCLGQAPNGYVRGEGMVVHMVRRLKDVRAGANVHCVIEAVASTHHGRGGASSTDIVSTNVAAPTAESYTNSYNKCFEMNPSISKEDVVYLEMHATGK